MPFDVEIHFNSGHIQDALRYATKDLLYHMITNMENEPPDNDGGNRAPKGFIRHADGHLSPDFDSSDYDRALACVKEYVLHASYVIDAWRGKPKGSAMEVINEAIKLHEYQYFALEYAAKGLMRTIEENGLLVNYYLPDPFSPESGSGYPDFHETGAGAAASTLRAIEISVDPNPQTMSIMDAAIYMATHD